MQGRNVVLESKFGSPRIVNDGVTVAKEVELEDPVENIGAKLVRQARHCLSLIAMPPACRAPHQLAADCQGRVFSPKYTQTLHTQIDLK